MILISSDQYDYTTNTVIDWLISFKKQFVRINKGDNYKIYFDGLDLKLSFDDKLLSFDNIDGYFYRRGKIRYIQNNEPITYLTDIKDEHAKIIDEYINYLLENKSSIGKYSDININKLIVLDVAKHIGFKIPTSYIFEKKDDAQAINETLITKNHSNTSFFQCEDGVLISYTSVLNENNSQYIPSFFSPSLFQEKIEKKYEIRVFYLKEKIWSMAIFSQTDTATSNDYRKLSQNIVRNVPYSLPSDIEKKIIILMNRLNLDTGSIDLIVNKENEYVFLEVNPIGQFDSLSFNCNFNIEKEIAKLLANENK